MKTYRDKKTGRYITSPATRSQNLHSELYRAFDFFNDRFAEKKLPKVVITVQESGRRNAYGWFGNAFWSDGLAGDKVPEIRKFSGRGINLSGQTAYQGSTFQGRLLHWQ